MKFTEKLYCNHDVYCMGGKKFQLNNRKKMIIYILHHSTPTGILGDDDFCETK